MPLKGTNLLKEYFLANNTAKYICGGSKCSWNKESSHLNLQKAPYIFCIFLGVLFGLVGAYHAAQLSLGKTSHNDYKGVGVIFSSGPFIVYFYTLNYLWNRKELELLFNSLLKIEDDCKGAILKQKSGNIRVAKLACWLLRVAGIWQISLSIALGATLLPELPFNIFENGIGPCIFQTLKNQVEPWQYVRLYIEKGTLFLGNLIMWTVHVKISLVGAIEIIMISACFVVLIKEFEDKLVVTLASFGCNQVAAALQLINSAGLSAKAEELSFHEMAVKYAMSAFAFSILCNLLVVINFLFGCCAQVNDTSLKGLSKLHRRQEFKTSKRFEKVVKSLPVLKIKFGSDNYIEKQTPVLFQMFLVQRFIDALLIN